MAVGKEVAPVIRKQGEKLLPESVKGKSSDGKSKVDGILDVAGAGTLLNVVRHLYSYPFCNTKMA
jgi:hypothetical protein